MLIGTDSIPSVYVHTFENCIINDDREGEQVRRLRSRRVIVTGGSGQLGSAIQRLMSEYWTLDCWSSGQVDVRQWRAIRDRVVGFQPDLVIHAAAMTDVDRCEREPDVAFAVNGLGTRHVAQAAAAAGAEFLYVSTNYVFDGEKSGPYHEFDTPGPISAYGASKLAGEDETRTATSRHWIARTAWLYSSTGKNFMRTMRCLMAERSELQVVSDQFGNPTLADDLAAMLAAIVGKAPYGTYHTVNSGSASWHDWATAIAEMTGATTQLQQIPGADYRRDATPPRNGAMISLALPALGIEQPDWRDALARCLAQ
jgi:dTDP-4-dehydrorhamnose reductase